ATAIFILAALTVCYPMLAGKFLLGEDQFQAGYAFRLFGAMQFRQTGAIPQWDPYLFGGMPFIAAMHGDIFYPTAWLRWILPIDTAMNLGLALHIVLAGGFMYLLLRALRLRWTAAVFGGLAYQLSGIVASQVSPGHDGKLYVSALAPLAFFALLKAVRERRIWGYPLLSLIVGLALVSPHFQMTYYLLVALGLWTLYLVFFDPERPAGQRWPVPLSAGALAVVLGFGISAIQTLPFLEYVPYSPRAAGEASASWEYATSWSMPPEEIFTTVLPQFNGVLDQYWGRNHFKSHTEYLGVAVVIPFLLAFGDRKRKPLILALAGIGTLFLLIAFGGHTPFYRLWYEVMPFMKKVRAAGMAFYLVALPVSVLAALGVERVLRREVHWRTVLIPVAGLSILGLLGVVGGLQTVAGAFVAPEQTGQLAANAEFLRAGALRMLVFVVLSGFVLWAILRGMFRGWVPVLALALVVTGDLWSIDRLFFHYSPPAAELFREDPVVSRMKQDTPPFRVWDPRGIYPGSFLMAYDLQYMVGYHGNEVRFYDNLLGGKLSGWPNQDNPNLWDLLALKYIIFPQSIPIPGYHEVLGPATTNRGLPAVLYQRDSSIQYVRVLAAAAKIPDDQLIPTVLDPRFPADRLVLYSDTASVSPTPLRGSAIPASPVSARLLEWRPGEMRIALDSAATTPQYLLVSETWFPDWHAAVDGTEVPVLRGDNALLSVVIPPGAREVRLWFRDSVFPRGKAVTWASLGLTGLLLLGPAFLRRRTPGG
ncbi:MAG: YfhO family protein, partial [Gemmatimonadales bacterium]